VGRRLVFPSLLAVATAIAYGWAELTGYVWTDYERANEVPLRALVHGHVDHFFQAAPIDGPSLLLRAPFAFGSWLWAAATWRSTGWSRCLVSSLRPSSQ
jgi:hypothetical protein